MDTPDFLAEGANINPQTPNPTPNPENAPQTPSGKGKKIFATIATLAVVLTSSVYYFGFSGAQADDNPPTLESSDSAGYQGFIRADKKKFGFSQFEKKDVEAFKTKERKHKEDKLTPLTLKMTAANKGTYYLYWNGDIKNKRTNEISFAEILENVEAKEDGVIFAAKYDAGKKRFISTPHKYFKEEVNNVKVLESKSIADMGQVTVRPGEVFILMASMPEFKVYGLGDGTKKYKGDTPKLADLPKGWNLLVANTDNLRGMLEKQAQYIDRIYPQEDLSLEPFKKGYDNDELPSKIKHHVFWVKTQEADKKKVDHKKESVTAPTNLKAYYELDNKSHFVNLTWDASPKAVDGYEIELYRNTKLIDTTKMKGHSSGTYGLEITEPGAYQFKMTAYKGKEKSKTVASNEVDVEVLKKDDTDKNKVETPKNLKLFVPKTKDQLALTWDIPKEKADSYDITVTKDGKDLETFTVKHSKLERSGVMSFELNDSQPFNAGKYSMKVKANLGTKKSDTATSNVVTIEEIAKVTVQDPTNLTATYDKKTKTLTITWDVVDGHSYVWSSDGDKDTYQEVEPKDVGNGKKGMKFTEPEEGEYTIYLKSYKTDSANFIHESKAVKTTVKVDNTADKKDEKPKEETKVDESASKATKDGAEVKVSEKKGEEGKSKVTCKDENGKEVTCKVTFNSSNSVYVIGGLSAGNYTYTFTNSLGTVSYSNNVAQVSKTNVKLFNDTQGFPDYVSPGMKEQLVANVDILTDGDTELYKIETVIDSNNKFSDINNIQIYLNSEKLDISRVSVGDSAAIYNVISKNNKITKGKTHNLKVYADIQSGIPVSTTTGKKFLRVGIGQNTGFLNAQYNDTQFSGLFSPYTPVYKNAEDYNNGAGVAREPKNIKITATEGSQSVTWDAPKTLSDKVVDFYQLAFTVKSDQSDYTVKKRTQGAETNYTFNVDGEPTGEIEVTAFFKDGDESDPVKATLSSGDYKGLEVTLNTDAVSDGTELEEGNSNLLASFNFKAPAGLTYKITELEFAATNAFVYSRLSNILISHSFLSKFGEASSTFTSDEVESSTAYIVKSVKAENPMTVSSDNPNIINFTATLNKNDNDDKTLNIQFNLKSITYELNGKTSKKVLDLQGPTLSAK